ncbi:MAG: autotransporter outer membrane beta-barrel domain-containing protein [Burkholderiaceae bacterium]|nr:autotransporter outer membrane beta-barrel domain-containing protein [Burkholderiaceae bacterium]
MTAQLYRGDGLITDSKTVINGIHDPNSAQLTELLASGFFSVPLDVAVGGSGVGKFSRPQVADAAFWNTTACRDTNTCSIGRVVGGQPYLIPYGRGQVAWEEGDYIQISASTDPDHPYLIEQYASNGALKQTVGTGQILNLDEQYFFVAGSDTTYPPGGGDGTGIVFGASAVTATSLSLTGLINPTVAQVNEYLRVHYSAMPAVKSVVNSSYLAQSATGDSWATAATKVQLTDSQVRTYGTNAHGMVIQNLGSVGGAWSSRGEKLTMGVSLVGQNAQGNTPGGKVDLTLSNSSVAVYGPRSRGVVIQADGAGPGGSAGQAQIKVALSNGSSIYAAQHTALMLVGGSYSLNVAERNTITVDSSSSITSGLYQQFQNFALDDTDAAYNKWAVYAPTGYTNLTNDGTVTGNILLGIVTKGDFVNNGTWYGSTAMVATNSLHNHGVIYAGGDGTVGGLHIEGAFKHYEGGEIHLDVHPSGEGATHDLITVTGLARIEGEIVPQTQSLLAADYSFLSAGGLEHTATIRDAHVFDWDMTASGNTLTKSVTADFTPRGYGLTGNQQSVAQYLQRLWDASSAEHATLFGYVHEHDSGLHGDYQNTLNQLSGQVLNSQAIEMKTVFATSLSDSLSCPTVTEQGLKLNQTNCAWARLTGSIAEQSANSANSGYHVTAGGIRLGAQRVLSGQWTTGFSLGYANNYLTSTGLTSNGSFLMRQSQHKRRSKTGPLVRRWVLHTGGLTTIARLSLVPMGQLLPCQAFTPVLAT